MDRLLPLGFTVTALSVCLLVFGFFTAVPAFLAYLLSLSVAAVAGWLSFRFGRGR